MDEIAVIVVCFCVVASFILPICSGELRCNSSVFSTAMIVVFLHQLVAFTNCFFFTTLGAGADASKFHRIGTELAQSGTFYFAIGPD